MTWRIYKHPSESDNENTTVNADGSETVESVSEPIDHSAQLQADLSAAKAEIGEWQDRFLRKAAEFENYRKRTDKEKADAMMLAKSSILIEFLPILDACERALKSFSDAQGQPTSLQQYKEGVELLFKQVLDTMSRTGVVPMETEGKQFDPHLHEALSREETAEFEENTVVRELRRGYLIKDKLLRPAQVIVSVHPVGKD
jgi:molecular chaperone GrpE